MRTTINFISWALFLALLHHMSDLEIVHKKNLVKKRSARVSLSYN